MTEYEEELLAMYNLLPRVQSLLERLLSDKKIKASEEDKKRREKLIERRAELEYIMKCHGVVQDSKESRIMHYKMEDELKQIMRELND